jgi:hypothetical protein
MLWSKRGSNLPGLQKLANFLLDIQHSNSHVPIEKMLRYISRSRRSLLNFCSVLHRESTIPDGRFGKLAHDTSYQGVVLQWMSSPASVVPKRFSSSTVLSNMVCVSNGVVITKWNGEYSVFYTLIMLTLKLKLKKCAPVILKRKICSEHSLACISISWHYPFKLI